MGETALTHKELPPAGRLPAGLPVLRARVMLRLLEDATLPVHKAAMLRGGFGYAFQRATCPASCWGQSERCQTGHHLPLPTGVRDAAQKMTLGGLLGRAVLRGVPPDVRTVLLAGSLAHVGKACVCLGTGDMICIHTPINNLNTNKDG